MADEGTTIVHMAGEAASELEGSLAKDLGHVEAVAEEAKTQTGEQWDKLTEHDEKLNLHNQMLNDLSDRVTQLPAEVGASATALLEGFESRLAMAESSLQRLENTENTNGETVEPPKPRENPAKSKPGGLRGWLHRLL